MWVCKLPFLGVQTEGEGGTGLKSHSPTAPQPRPPNPSLCSFCCPGFQEIITQKADQYHNLRDVKKSLIGPKLPPLKSSIDWKKRTAQGHEAEQSFLCITDKATEVLSDPWSCGACPSGVGRSQECWMKGYVVDCEVFGTVSPHTPLG